MGKKKFFAGATAPPSHYVAPPLFMAQLVFFGISNEDIGFKNLSLIVTIES